MTEKDIREAWGKVYPDEEPAIDFALDMVRRHNEECAVAASQYVAKETMGEPEAIRNAIRKLKP